MCLISLASSANKRMFEDVIDEDKSLTLIIKSIWPRTLPWGTPEIMGRNLDIAL